MRARRARAHGAVHKQAEIERMRPLVYVQTPRGSPQAASPRSSPPRASPPHEASAEVYRKLYEYAESRWVALQERVESLERALLQAKDAERRLTHDFEHELTLARDAECSANSARHEVAEMERKLDTVRSLHDTSEARRLELEAKLAVAVVPHKQTADLHLQLAALTADLRHGYGPCSYGLYSYVVCRYGQCSYGLYRYGLCSYGGPQEQHGRRHT